MNRDLVSYWTGKSVVVTGASSGLGAAVVAALAPYNVHFGLLSRREDRMKELVSDLGRNGSQFWIKACDVRDRDQVLSAIRAFHQEAGRLDVVWVNSGVGYDSSFRDWNWDTAENMIDTNLKGAIYTTIASLEVMVPQKAGTIVGICSAASMRGLGGRGIYSLTKIGLAYFLESMAVELPEIQFTIIHPGYVDTPINQGNPNRFWLMGPERAAQIMIKAVTRRKRVLIYPFRMNLFYRAVRSLPTPFYHWLGHRLMGLSRPAKTPRAGVSG